MLQLINDFELITTLGTEIILAVTHKIMILDDQPNIRKIFQYVLKEYFDLIVCEEPLKALELGDKVDLVVSDIMMPEMNGFQFFIAFRKRYGNIPFVFTSAMPQDKRILSGIQQSDDHVFLPKPVEPDHLKNTILKILEGSS